MRRSLPVLVLLFLPGFAQAGQLTLSPTYVYVDNSQQSTEILVSYQPNANVHYMNAYVKLDPDRLGWAEVQVVPPAATDYQTRCEVWSGQAHVVVSSPTSTAMPDTALIPVCRLRVRPHAHTPRGHYPVTVSNYAEHRVGILFPAYYTGASTRVVVP